jgi:chromosomal replication initiation ATPase DnaA
MSPDDRERIFLRAFSDTGTLVDALAVTASVEKRLGDTPTVSVPHIIELVCAHYSIDQDELYTRRRRRGTLTVSRARAVAWWLMKQTTKMSFQDLGNALGGFDHSSVIVSIKRVGQDTGKTAEALHLLTQLVPHPMCPCVPGT